MKRYLLWKTNILIIAVITMVLAAYSFWQMRQASEQFLRNAREHAQVVTAVVELTVRNAALSSKGLEEIVAGHLADTAAFIHYLHGVEPFSAEELASFAEENGLAGAAIFPASRGAAPVRGPAGWLNDRRCGPDAVLEKVAAAQLYIFSSRPQKSGTGDCVLVGISSRTVDSLQRELSVEPLLERLGRLEGIDSVRLKGRAEDTARAAGAALAAFGEKAGRRTTETIIPLEDKDLVVTLPAGHFARRMRQMQTEFLLFALFVLSFGGLSSWWLYRTEKQRLEEAVDFERRIARQHEEAALGRAAATIAHEIRNPLNAIGMGLQRLQIEAANLLEKEHLDLVAGMRDAVARSNTIVTGLQRYVGAFALAVGPVDMAGLLTEVMQLYRPQCESQAVILGGGLEGGVMVAGDRQLLGQLFENLLKNAIEAQPDGGRVDLVLRSGDGRCRVSLENEGFTLDRQQAADMFEPYFTTKTKGTGLGLAISRKIVEAHGGSLIGQPDYRLHILSLIVELPLWRACPSTSAAPQE